MLTNCRNKSILSFIQSIKNDFSDYNGYNILDLAVLLFTTVFFSVVYFLSFAFVYCTVVFKLSIFLHNLIFLFLIFPSILLFVHLCQVILLFIFCLCKDLEESMCTTFDRNIPTGGGGRIYNVENHVLSISELYA